MHVMRQRLPSNTSPRATELSKMSSCPKMIETAADAQKSKAIQLYEVLPLYQVCGAAYVRWELVQTVEISMIYLYDFICIVRV